MKKNGGIFRLISQKPFQLGTLVLVCMHLILLLLTVISHAFPVFIWQNAGAIAFFAILWTVHHFHPIKPVNAILVTVIGVWIQVYIAIFCTGIESGFQNYFFATLAASFFLTYSTRAERTSLISSVIEVGSFIAYITAVSHGTQITPLYALDSHALFIMNCINSIFSLLFIIFFADSYRHRLVNAVNNLQRAVNMDPLTNLLNRRGIRQYFDILQNEWVRQQKPYTIAILDIDDFKEKNDTLGHNEGDKILVAIAAVLSRYVDDVTWCCRWGGEEFLIVTQMHSSKTANISILNNILTDIRNLSVRTSTGSVQVTVTIGCAFSEPDMMIHELINKADNALYRGKTSGKNQVVLAN